MFSVTWRRAAALTAAVAGTLAVGLAMPASAHPTTSGALQAALASARDVTAPFPTWNSALAAGWIDPGLPCFDNSGDPGNNGGMGVHLLAPWVDPYAAPDPMKPNVLVFDPVTGHRVAVEWITTIPGQSLFGQSFEAATLPDGSPLTLPDGSQLYELHAYVWKPNPNGMFHEFNPNVNMCPAS